MLRIIEQPKSKRQKRVFADSRQVAHVWAQQSQEYGCNPSRNIYFEGDTIYSYGSHFPIARFARRDVVLVTTRSYSRTTSRHQSDVEDALRGLDVQIIRVPNVRGRAESNLELLWSELIQTAQKHKRARFDDYRPEMWRQIRNLAAYAKFARKGRTKQLAELVKAAERSPHFWATLARVSPKLAAEIDAEKQQRRDRREKQLAERYKHEEARRARFDELAEALKPLAIDAWRAGCERFAVPAELRERFADCLSESDITRGVYAENVLHLLCGSPTLLRIVGDEIQTSRGARVTIRAAVRAWPHLKAKQVPPHPVGQYAAREFRDGILYIGCHKIPVSEMNLIAQQLGLDGQISA